jgi:hypothetical protein
MSSLKLGTVTYVISGWKTYFFFNPFCLYPEAGFDYVLSLIMMYSLSNKRFMFYLHWPSKTGDVVHMVYEQASVMIHATILIRKENSWFLI